MIQAQLLTIAVYGLIAWWYVAPSLNKLPRVQALTAILWVHVFATASSTSPWRGAKVTPFPMWR